MLSNDHIKTVALIHCYNKKLLLCRSKAKTAFYMPGGKIEVGESLEQALEREVQEELSITLSPADYHYYDTFTAQAYGEENGRQVSIACYLSHLQEKITSFSNEIGEIRYFSHAEYSAMHETAPAVLLITDRLRFDGFID